MKVNHPDRAAAAEAVIPGMSGTGRKYHHLEYDVNICVLCRQKPVSLITSMIAVRCSCWTPKRTVAIAQPTTQQIVRKEVACTKVNI